MGSCCGASKHEELFKDLKRMIEAADECKKADIQLLENDLQKAKQEAHRLVQDAETDRPLAERKRDAAKNVYTQTLKSVNERLDEEIKFYEDQKKLVIECQSDSASAAKGIAKISKDQLQEIIQHLSDLRKQMQQIAEGVKNFDYARLTAMEMREDDGQGDKCTCLMEKCSKMAEEVRAFTEQVTHRDRTEAEKLHKEIDALNEKIKQMEEEAAEYKKWRGEVIKQNNLLKEDIGRYEVVSKRRSMVGDVLQSRQSPAKGGLDSSRR